jgi:ABC-type multidrug transport system fused ATPase/permease subunit
MILHKWWSDFTWISRPSTTISCGSTIAAIVGLTYVTHRWQQSLRERHNRPKRQFLLHMQMESFLKTFENAAFVDAECFFRSDSGEITVEHQCQARAILDQVDISESLVPLRVARLCDLDSDLVLRVAAVIMHVVTLRVVIQPNEAAEGTSIRNIQLPKSYFPFDAMFQFGRSEWEASVVEILGPLSIPREHVVVVSRAADSIRKLFINETLPILQRSIACTHHIGWRLFSSKVLRGNVGPVFRNRRRHVRVLSSVVGIILGNAFLEALSYTNVLVQQLVHIGALASVSQFVTAGTQDNKRSADTYTNFVRPQIIVLWVKTSLLLLRAFSSPWMDRLAATVRLELQAEWTYELSITAAQMEEPMRSQPSFQKVCSPSSSKRLTTAVADWMVKGCIEHYGRSVGCLAILGVQLYRGDRFLPFAAFVVGLTHSGTWIPWLGLSGLWPFSSHDFTQQSGTIVLLDNIDASSPPMQSPLCGIRTLLQLVADMSAEESHCFRPHLSLMLLASSTSFGETGCVPLCDTNVASLQRVEDLAISARKSACIQRLVTSSTSPFIQSIWKYFEYAHNCCLTPALEQSKAHETSVLNTECDDTTGDVRQRYLDGEETELLKHGASRYLLATRSFYKLFQPSRYYTLRTLGLDVLHAHREVRDFSIARQRSLWEVSSAFLDDTNLGDIVLTYALMALEEYGHEVVLSLLLKDAIPPWLHRRHQSQALRSIDDPRKLFAQEQLSLLLAYRNIFERIGFGGSLFARAHSGDGSRAKRAKEMEELMTVLPTLHQSHDNERGRQLTALRMRIMAAALTHRREIRFNDAGFITSGFVLREGISFNDVTLTYPGSSAVALDRVSFTASVGTMTAIIGRTGSGKSSLIHLLAGVYRPLGNKCEESILLDGIPLTCFEPRYLRQLIAQVPQHPYVNPQFSFAQNIVLFRSASMEQVERAAKLANCEEFILATPLGYHNPAGPYLSGGEKQRLEIARAILENPQILILDEATSKLDAITEHSVQKTFSTLQCTIVAVAHRMATLRSAGKYVVLHDGVVLEEGSHEELIHHSKVDDACEWSYRKQLQLQSLSSATAE